MRGVFVVFGVLTCAVVWVLGPRGRVSDRPPIVWSTDMALQPRYDPQASSPFFADGRAMRTPPAGTVAFGGADYASDAGSPWLNPDFVQADDALYRGKQGDAFVDQVPLKVDMALLKRGQERYNVYCAVCHGATGSGNGIATKYGMVSVVSFHDDLHRMMPPGMYFDVLTKGKGLMMPYTTQLSVRDRWAVVAYLGALMRSQHASLADVPENLRGELNR